MGLSNSSGNGGIILTASKGMFIRRVPEGTEGAVRRELEKGPNAGSTVWEMKYTGLEGYIRDITFLDTDHGTNALIKIEDDDGGAFTLSLPSDSGYLMDIAKCVPNIDKDLPVKLNMGKQKDVNDNFKTTKNGNFIYRMWVNQDGQNVARAFTRDNPNGMPEAVQRRGKWDFSEQEDFLLGVLEEAFEAPF